jgi:hypothetical protein
MVGIVVDEVREFFGWFDFEGRVAVGMQDEYAIVLGLLPPHFVELFDAAVNRGKETAGDQSCVLQLYFEVEGLGVG